ncbi:hypothetical protein F5Y14DRAFT_68489 [Nemania sp. NC0429]|nr:hypothetical protein F5Y14DRAFT_68489 [Nemania sp. NC0429]
MRLSPATITATLLVILGSSHLAHANANAEPKPDTAPDVATPTTGTGTTTAKQQTAKARERAPNLLSTLYQLASTFDLRACIPAALPLITTLPRIPPALVAGDAVSQALSQTTRELDAVCDFSVTGDAGDTFTSFLPVWYDWYSRHSGRVARVTTKCPAAAALVRTVEAYGACPQVLAILTAASAGASASSTGTRGDGDGDGDGGGEGKGGETGLTSVSQPVETKSPDSTTANILVRRDEL